MRTLLLLCLLSLVFCSCNDSRVNGVLKNAGKNRSEFETVLRHYENEPMKLQAARFLIENMDVHYSHGGDAVDEYNKYIDSVFTHCNGDRAFWIMKYDTILRRVGYELELCRRNKSYDIQHLTADFLIGQIDSAFTVWQQKWNKQYSFDMFCKYVLPYRIGNEKISEWRTVYTVPDWVKEAYAPHADNTTYAYGMANDILGSMRSEIYYPSQFLPDLPLTVLRNIKSASCKEYAHLCVTMLRTHGLPATIDFTPQWGNRSMGHEWCVFFPNDDTFIPFNPGERLGDHFMKRKEDRLTKVFRMTYEKQNESLYMLNGGKEDLPPVFDTPNIMDVTDLYTQTSDVQVPLYKDGKETKYIYLSVFDNQNWSIVHWGVKKDNVAEFKGMARGVVYMPVYYSIIEGITAAGDPFLLNEEGEMIRMVADTTSCETVRVKRKFRDVRSNQFLQGVIGGKFQVASDENFTDTLTVHVIPHLTDNKYHLVNLDYDAKYRFFRYLSPDWSRGNMAELYTFNSDGDTLKPKRLLGNFHVRPWRGPETLFDGDVLSFYDSHDISNVWYGWEYPEPVTVSQILFLPRNDDNFIREGEDYELFYWQRNGWVSLGRQLGNFKAELDFDNVPQRAILRLHNHTKGSEERIFTYENGKQIWW